ncbi:MAG: hypothetical protein EA380_11090 [Phycisphaeraceae bacterium]|nr:MAG: hypothetical protein EA380_11090 [Phycisphaeraceae bacterium]
MRIGPMVFVPEFRTTPGYDPWAHRKGEPRILALFWAVFLMGGAMITIFGARSIGIPTNAQYRYGCMAMCLLAGVGVAVLWPMVRLSQRPPIRPTRAALQDFVALMIPLQAVIWPMPLLTAWPYEVIGAIMLSLVSWGLLSCGVIAWGTGSQSGAVRTLWMGLVLLLVGLGPVIWMLNAGLPGPQLPEWWAVTSILTTPSSVVSSPGNLTPRVMPSEWLVMSIPGIGGLGLLIASCWRAPLVDPARLDPRLPSGTEAP